jgi:hypothetical protein
MTRSRVTSTLLAGAALALSASGAGVAPALAKDPVCPAHSGALANDGHGFGRVWHQGSSLYACTTVYGHRPRAKRMGPWTPFTKVAFDGVNLAWTVRMHVGGKATDRVWAANVDSRSRWMLGQKPNPAGATLAARETLLQRLVVVDQSVTWVTRTKDVVAVMRDPAGDPAPIGTWPTPPAILQKKLLPLGTYPGASAAGLAASLKVKEEDGDGDECGGVNPYRITFRPAAAAAELGVLWDGDWTSTNCS